MSRSASRQLDSRLLILLLHLLKWARQPDRRSPSWRRTIEEQRRAIDRLLRRNPALHGPVVDRFQAVYPNARRLAAAEMGIAVSALDATCPFKVEDALDPEYFPPERGPA